VIEGGVLLNSTPDSSDAASVSSGASETISSKGDNVVNDPNVDIVTQLKNLAIHNGWSKKEKKQRRLDAFDEAWNAEFGKNKMELEDWQDLCMMCKIETAPKSINKCKKV
jgi:hypothetical protein